MVVALLIRRAQLLVQGEPDPFPVSYDTDSLPGGAELIDSESEKMAILRLVYVLERGFEKRRELFDINNFRPR